MRVVLVRHGQTSSNARGLLDTAAPGADLTDLGREQAAALVDLLDGQRVDAIFASTLVRSQQTAAALAADRDLEIQVRDGLREIAASELEMAGDEASIRRYLQTIGAWMSGDLQLRMPGGPPGAEELDRFDAVVRDEAKVLLDAAGPHACLVIVGHGAMLRLWAGVAAANLPAAFGARHPLHNTGMIVLEGAPDAGWRAISWMDAAIEELDEAVDGPAGEVVRADSPTRRG